MARALPFHVRQVFALMQFLGWSQKQCAEALGLIPQAVNNWAAAGMNVPVKYRGPLVSLVTLAIHHALDAVKDNPTALDRRTKEIHHYISQWFYENLEARGTYDTAYAAIGRKLAQSFKAPLSTQSVEELAAALALHRQAETLLRRLIQRQESDASPTALEPNFGPTDDPAERLWFLAEHLNGAPLQESAELQAWNDQDFEVWVASLPAEKRAGLEARRNASAKKNYG